jgi:predicted phosphodiesterase
LSDIHFRKSEIETAQDPNFHLRNELLLDAEQLCKTLGKPDVVLLSGDIAFAGGPQEYQFATAWLSKLCARCGAEMNAIFVIPGNHDVERRAADKRLVQMLHKEIKGASDITLDVILHGFLTEKETARLLYESIDNYNAFAQQFLCDLLPPDRTRTLRELQLNDGSTLRLWGLYRLAERFGWVSSIILKFGLDPWSVAARNAANDLEADDDLVFRSFLLALALEKGGPEALDVIQRCFAPIHDRVLRSYLPWRATEILLDRLPSLSWARSWDTGLRLRLAVVEAFVRNGFDSQRFAQLSNEKKVRRLLQSAAEEVDGGGRYAYAISM